MDYLEVPVPAPLGVGVDMPLPLEVLPPTVPDEEPVAPAPTEPVLPVPALPPVVLPALPPVLLEGVSRSFRHFSFIVRSLSFSQLARAAAWSVVLPVAPLEAEPLAPVDPLVEPEAPALEDGVLEELEDGELEDPVLLEESVLGVELELVEGLEAEPEVVLPDVLPEVWATAAVVAARNAAAIAACRIFIVIVAPRRLR